MSGSEGEPTLKTEKQGGQGREDRALPALTPRRKLIYLLANFVLLFAFYYVSMKLEWIAVTHIYMISLCVLLCVVIWLNRGFGRGLPEREALPASMSEDEKTELLSRLRRDKTRMQYVLLVLIPLMLIMGLDFIFLNFIAK